MKRRTMLLLAILLIVIISTFLFVNNQAIEHARDTESTQLSDFATWHPLTQAAIATENAPR